jgi:hypothetical protein
VVVSAFAAMRTCLQARSENGIPETAVVARGFTAPIPSFLQALQKHSRLTAHFEQAICFPSLTTEDESDCDPITAQQVSHCLTSIASRDRVAASFTLFRPANRVSQGAH